jgi:MarR family transcriptional regulator, 2-MHQ and catechol-resistance regulon repressor
MRSPLATSDLEDRALRTYVKLMRAAGSFTSRAHQHLDEAGLTFSQFAVLDALYHLGPLHLKDLAEKMLKTSGNLTMVVDNLEKCGLVKRKQEHKDKRFFSVHLTPKGRSTFERLFPRHIQILVSEMSPLTDAEQEELGRLCRKLGKAKAKLA